MIVRNDFRAIFMISASNHGADLSKKRLSNQETSPPIVRDLPFGITTIIGGTNLRFSLSSLGENSAVDTRVSWQELLRNNSSGIATGDSTNTRSGAFQDIGRRFVGFIENNSKPDPKGPPLSQLHTLIFSVAGIVDGDKVSLTNAPLGIVRTDLAHEIIAAVNDELSRRGYERCAPQVVAVVNDAVAGLMGELKAGGLQGIKNGAFIILGTGKGGICCVEGKPCSDLDELGHRTLVNRNDLSVRILVGDELAPFLRDTGEFVTLQGDEAYAEHYLAGPWVATRFIKTLSERDGGLLACLSERIALSHGLSDARVGAGLDEIQRLPARELHLWGQRAPSDILKCVNQFLFTPDVAHVIHARRRLKSSAVDLNETLTSVAYQSWRDYFGLLGRCGGAINGTLAKMGHPMERIVLGGGIGEACNLYPTIWKKHAYGILHAAANVAPGSIIFSPMRAEEREKAIATASIREAFEAKAYH